MIIGGGQTLVSAPPSFSNDGKKLLVCSGNTVSVFSTVTGMLVCELEGHTSRVTSVVVVPAEPDGVKFLCYCWTSSLDGSICYWDFSVPELIKKISVQLPIVSMVIPNLSHSSFDSSGKKSSLYAFISVEDTSIPADQEKALRGMIRVCDLNKSRIVGGVLTQTRKPGSIVMSPSNDYIGIANKRKIHIWRISGSTSESYLKDIKMIKLHHTKKFSTLAFHPARRMVAAGDVTGRILIWRGFGDRKFFGKTDVRGEDDADPAPTTWHWHASEIKILLFSSDGAYLYSGAKEGVIVVWQLDTGKRKYKPRLGSPLLFYTPSPDPSVSCVSCADNQIHILKMPRMEVIKTVSGIRPPFSSEMPKDFHGGLAFNNAAAVVALPTQNYCVQIYSLFDNKEVSHVQVCERNYQPVEDNVVYVDRVSLSVDGALMATVDIRLPEEDIGAMVSLKFWSFDDRIRKYVLSTVIYEPHGDAGVSDLTFHTKESMAVTTSHCGEFKIWVHISDMRNNLSWKSGWRCQSIGSYKKRPMTAAAFSADGSVLAIAVENVVTLWDPITNALVSVIGETKMPISRLSFVGRSQYLLTVSHGLKPQLVLWSMSTLSIIWSYKLIVESVACKNDGSGFAVLAERSIKAKYSSAERSNGFILVFNMPSEVPVAVWSVNKVKGGRLAFIQPESSFQQGAAYEKLPSEMLAYLNSEREFIVFDPYGDESQNIGQKSLGNKDMHDETEDLHGYASIYGKLPTDTVKNDQISAIPFSSSRPWETMFSGSSHALPPLTKLCASFLESLLEKKVSTAQ